MRPPSPDISHLRVSIMGLGLIGGSVLRALAHARGWDTDEGVRREATQLGYDITLSVEDALEGSDLVVVATPLASCAKTVLTVLELSPQATVVDVGSVKEPILEDVLASAGEHAARYVPTHPLAGAEYGGWERSTPTLLSGAPWAVCPHPSLDVAHLWQATTLISALDGYVIGTQAGEHDRVAAYSSHVPHLLASVLAAYAPHDIAPRVAALHSGSLRDATRVASAPTVIWGGVFSANAQASLEALDTLIAQLGSARAVLAEADWDALEDILRTGRGRKELLEETRFACNDWQEETWQLSELGSRLLTTGGARAGSSALGEDVQVWTRKAYLKGSAW